MRKSIQPINSTRLSVTDAINTTLAASSAMMGSNPLIDVPHQPSKWSAFLDVQAYSNNQQRCSAEINGSAPSWNENKAVQYSSDEQAVPEPKRSSCHAALPSWQHSCHQQQHDLHYAQQLHIAEQPWQPDTIGLNQQQSDATPHSNSTWKAMSNCMPAMLAPQQHQHQLHLQQQKQKQGWKTQPLQLQQQTLHRALAGQQLQQPAAAADCWQDKQLAGAGKPWQQQQQQQRQPGGGKRHALCDIGDDDIELPDEEPCFAYAAICSHRSASTMHQSSSAAAADSPAAPAQQPHQQWLHHHHQPAGTTSNAQHASAQWDAQHCTVNARPKDVAAGALTQQPAAQESKQCTSSPQQQPRIGQQWHRDQQQPLTQQQALLSTQLHCERNARVAAQQRQQQLQGQHWPGQVQPQQAPWQLQQQQQLVQHTEAKLLGLPSHHHQQQQLGAARTNPGVGSRWASSNISSQPLRVARPSASAAILAAGLAPTSAPAANAGFTGSGQGSRHKGKRSDGKAADGGLMRTQKAGGQTCGNIERDFVRRGPGSMPAEPKMMQASIQQTLQRAKRKRQEEEGQQQQQRGLDAKADESKLDTDFPAGTRGTDSSAARKFTTAAGQVDAGACGAANKSHTGDAAATACKRKKGVAAACGDVAATASGRNQRAEAGSGRGASSTRRTAGTTAAQLAAEKALQEATEILDLYLLGKGGPCASASSHTSSGPALLDLSSTDAWQQLLQQSLAADAVALGLLLCQKSGQAVQYCSSLQPLTKQQLQLLKKGARASNKVAAASVTAHSTGCKQTTAAAAGAAEEDSSVAPTKLDVVGVAFMPAVANASHHENPAMYYLHIPALSQQQQPHMVQSHHQQLPEAVLLLLSQLLQSPGSKCPLVCSNAKVVLCFLAGLGLQLPAAADVTLVDPEVLAWLADPQLVQDTKQDSGKPADCYRLQATLERYGMQGQSSGSPAPLQRLHQQLYASISLADCLLRKLQGSIADRAITTEMQVTTILAKMELLGVGIDPGHLLGHKAALQQRVAALTARAAALAGRHFNLASASQLSNVLYEVLRLPPPADGGGRGCAKTHLPTDETALKQLELSTGHELPGLVIEYRSKMNALSKYFDAPWVQRAVKQAQSAAAQGTTGSGHDDCNMLQAVVDLRCCWNQTNTATGRLSSCSPNLQAVTKYSINSAEEEKQQHRRHGQAPHSSMPAAVRFSIRDVFVARPGYVLLSADYSQVELRLLAHFSGDQLLQQLLSQSGPTGDVFSLIAAAWQQPGGRLPAAGAQADPAMRERAKRVTYGICYGVGAYRLSQQLQDQGITVEQAQALIDSFLTTFSGVQHYMSTCLAKARAQGAVSTLLQRVRPIADLHSPKFQERSAAERKVVNTIIQGSAADLIKLAMCDWDAWAGAATATTNQPATVEAGSACARLIGQIHDELLFEVAASDCVYGPSAAVVQPGSSLLQVARVVKSIMQGAAQLRVGLRVRMSYGSRWGSMQTLEV